MSDFATQWPNYCRACSGWGGFSFQQSHPYGATSTYETMFDVCDALEPEVCHRCGAAGLQLETGEGPCSACGWNYDDGVLEPEYAPEDV